MGIILALPKIHSVGDICSHFGRVAKRFFVVFFFLPLILRLHRPLDTPSNPLNCSWANHGPFKQTESWQTTLLSTVTSITLVAENVGKGLLIVHSQSSHRLELRLQCHCEEVGVWQGWMVHVPALKVTKQKSQT